MLQHIKTKIQVYSILGAFISLLLIITLQNFYQMTEQFPSISVRIKSDGVTLRKIQNAMENEKKKESTHSPILSAFNIQEHIEIQEPDFERKENVSVYMVYGQMEQVLPMQLISGNFPYVEDTYGCVIDKKTAFSLFGSYEVLGKKIVCDDKSYYIRGIVDNTISVMLYQSNEKEEVFWNLELVFPGEENGRQLTENFILSHGLASDYIIVEGNYIVKLLGNMVGLPLLAIFFSLLKSRYNEGRRFLQKASDNKQKKNSYDTSKGEDLKYLIQSIWFLMRRKKVRIILWFISVILNLSLLFSSIRSFLYFPKRFIPTKWSDFSHWSSIARELKEHYNQIISLVPIKKDIDLMQNITLNVLLSIICLMLLGMLYIYRNSYKTNEKEF